MSDKSIVVLGATGGIGGAVCEGLKADGVNVIPVARNESALKTLSADLNLETYACDILQPDAVRVLFQSLKERYGEIHGLVSSIGSILLKPLHLTTEDEWFNVINTNLTSAFFALKYGIPVLSDNSSVVLFSSVAGEVGLANHEAISAAKAGVAGLVRSAAATYSKRGIRINAVSPSLTETELSKKITSNPTALEFSINMHPLGRIGQPADISKVVELLLSEKASWITGQVFNVDGGLSKIRK